MSRTLMPSLAAKAVNYTLLTWIALIFIFPIVFMIVSSLKPDLQLLQDSSSLRAFLPVGDISFDNYSAAFQRVPIASRKRSSAPGRSGNSKRSSISSGSPRAWPPTM